MVGRGWLSATSLATYEVAQGRLVLPDTSVDLVWVDGRIDLIGPMSVARPARYAIGTRVMLLSVAPATAAAWLGIPLSEVTDRVVDLRDIHAETARELQRLFESDTVSDLVGSLAPACSRVTVAASALARGVSVAEVADAVNLCARQLTRSFHEIIGLQPKRFQRITRLRRAVAVAKSGLSLAEAAIEAGYADQAHFTRDMKSLTGAAPRTILPNVGNVQDMSPHNT